jgi:Cu/Zn superoxide dismutase
MRTSTLLLTIFSSLSLTAASPTKSAIAGQEWPIKAVAVLTGKVSGTVTLVQEDEDSPTKITYDLAGNDPNASRGFHIHQFGDLTKGCDRLVTYLHVSSIVLIHRQ